MNKYFILTCLLFPLISFIILMALCQYYHSGMGRLKKEIKKRDKKCLKMRFIVMKSKMFASYNRSKISAESKNM